MVLGDSPSEAWSLLGLEMLVEVGRPARPQAHPVGELRAGPHAEQDRGQQVVPRGCVQRAARSGRAPTAGGAAHPDTGRCQDRLEFYIRMEEYMPRCTLSLSYWKELAAKSQAMEELPCRGCLTA